MTRSSPSPSRPPSSRAEAVAFLDARIDRGVLPGLERIAGLLDLMGDPHRQVPVIHVAGTNGKTTVVRMISALLAAHGLSSGWFVSPHLQRVEERFGLRGAPLDAAGLVAAVADVAPFVELFEERSGDGPTYFELTAAVAFAMFVAQAVDVAVVEVGLGGRWDATNVVDADVSVVTGIALDHTRLLGETVGEIAAEKVAILKDGGRLVSGPLPAGAEGPLTAQVAATGSTWFRSGEHFTVAGARGAVGGWVADIEAIFDGYDDLYLPLHGRHQVDNLATAMAAVEVFFARALDPEAVAAATAGMRSPGRLEVVGRSPLVIIDGAHNVEGMSGLATALRDEFLPARRTLVVGFGGDRDPATLLAPLVGAVDDVVATAAADGAALPADDVAAAARSVFGPEVPVRVATPVGRAAVDAVAGAGVDDHVVVSGSLYVAGEARTALVPDSSSPVRPEPTSGE